MGGQHGIGGTYKEPFQQTLHATHREVTSEGTLFEAFENLPDWTIGGTDCTQELSTNAKQGTYSLKLNSSISAAPYSTKTISQNFSATKNFILWVYNPDRSKMTTIYVYLSSVSSFAKDFHILLEVDNVGWNRCVFDKSKFSVTGGESWSNTMIRLRVKPNITVGQLSYALFDDLKLDYAARPKVIITADDGMLSFYQKAVPIMAANGQRGVEFVVTDWIGTGGYVTMANLQTLYAAEWDIANHTKSHPDLTAITETQMHSEINDAAAVLSAFTSKTFLAYPGGSYNQTVIDYLKLINYRFARNIRTAKNQPQITIVNNMPYEVKALIVANTVTPATVIGYIDQLIIQCGLLVMLFHKIVDSGADESTKYLTADFQTISDYLKTKSDAGLLDVITFTDYYSGFYY